MGTSRLQYLLPAFTAPSALYRRSDLVAVLEDSRRWFSDGWMDDVALPQSLSLCLLHFLMRRN